MTVIHDGPWWNERMENALDRVTPAVEAYAQQLLVGAEMGLNFGIGFQPIQYEDLLGLEPEVAITAIGRMMQYPNTQQQGVEYFARLLQETDGLQTLGVTI